MDIPIAMCDHRRVTGVDMVCFIPTINGLQRQLSWCNHGDGCRSFKERGSLYPLVNIQKAIEMAIEIVDLPKKNGDFPWLC
jgi:hypothetical protein